MNDLEKLTMPKIVEMKERGIELCPYIRNPLIDVKENVYGRCAIMNMQQCPNRLQAKYETSCPAYIKIWGTKND